MARSSFFLIPLSVIGVAALYYSPAFADKAVSIPPPALDAGTAGKTQIAILAGGCFWGLEGVFENVKGVRSVVSGYAGGTAQTANYPDVTTEKTGHAESIKVVYDPKIVSYGTLLRIFFAVAHDPTQLNRQGPDTGPSYRSAVFPVDADQAKVARAYIVQLGKSGAWNRPIVTKVESGTFYPAESYHQDFMRRNPDHGYIVRFDKPKLAAFKAGFPALAK